MKCTLSLVLMAAIGLLNAVKGQEETISERTFRKLHQGPPLPKAASLNRARQYLWIDQKLDNFNATEARTWKMRYASNDEFYQEGGPFFILVGGEWEISQASVTAGHFYDLAEEHNGYLFYTEHRFYGQSKPTSNLDYENLKYLNVRQALADLAHFIEEMRAIIPGATNSKVILAGGSYAATMATWFMKLYPNLAAGAWASSAPLLAKADFVEYKEVAGQSIRLLGGEECYNRIQNGFAEMETLFATNRGAEVKALLNLCDAFDEYNYLDLWTFFSETADVIAGLAQTHYFGDIESVCSKIMESETDIIGVTDFLLTQFDSNSCTALEYEAIIGPMMNTSYTSSIKRQWTYQTCNEFGYFQTSGSKNQPFGNEFPIPLYIQRCQDIYGKQFTERFVAGQVAATNYLFGGLEPNVENVYFTHGQLDPWRSMGIQYGKQATVIPLYSHNRDMDSISDNDTAEMRASKQKIAELVRKWLGADNAAIGVDNKVERSTL